MVRLVKKDDAEREKIQPGKRRAMMNVNPIKKKYGKIRQKKKQMQNVEDYHLSAFVWKQTDDTEACK